MFPKISLKKKKKLTANLQCCELLPEDPPDRSLADLGRPPVSCLFSPCDWCPELSLIQGTVCKRPGDRSLSWTEQKRRIRQSPGRLVRGTRNVWDR